MVPEMPRNVSVINETETTVSLTASVPRRRQSTDTLPVTTWRIQYESDSTDGDTLTRIFNTSRHMRHSPFSIAAGNGFVDAGVYFRRVESCV